MKSWADGKRELQTEFNRICATIDENIRKETHDTETVQISKQELQTLRVNSAQVEKLVRHNVQLTEELREFRAIAAKVDSIQRENRRLKNKLDLNIRPLTQEDDYKSRHVVEASSKSLNSDLPHNKNKLVDHQRLIAKNEILSKNCDQLKEAWSKMERKLREQKKKNKEWASHVQQKDDAIKVKSTKVKELERIVKNLKAKLDDKGISFENLSEVPFEPITAASNSEGKKPKKLSSPKDLDTSLYRFQSKISSASGALDGQETLQSSSPSHLEDCHLDVPNWRSEDLKQNKDYSKTDINRLWCTGSVEKISGLSSQTINNTDQSNTRELSVILPGLSENPPIISPNTKKSLKRKEYHRNDEKSPEEVDDITRSPIGIHGLQYLNDSIDLDEIGVQFKTPRKQRRFLDLTIESNELSLNSGSSKISRLNSLNVSHRKKGANKLDHSLPNCHNILNYNISPLNQNNHNRNQRASEVSENYRKNSVTVGVTVTLESIVINILQKTLSPEFAICSDTSPRMIDKQLIPSSSAKEKGFGAQTPPSLRKISRDTKIFDCLSSKSTVSSLRKYPQQSSHEMVMPCAPTIFSTENPCDSKSSLEQSKSSLEDFPAHQTRQLSAENSSSINKIKSRKRPLRECPIEKLNIRDFKINPQYNQGYQYAYSEVVRGHARNGLKGCLKPCCEPKYRALAEISRNPNKKITLSQKEAENLMLEEYMGDNAYKLINMSEAERDELLILAKTRDLANKHGNHRHMYENPETPVGIWRADFPTTQEVIEEGKKIEERTRKIVKRRYAEAMRPGGAYKFRDE